MCFLSVRQKANDYEEYSATRVWSTSVCCAVEVVMLKPTTYDTWCHRASRGQFRTAERGLSSAIHPHTHPSCGNPWQPMARWIIAIRWLLWRRGRGRGRSGKVTGAWINVCSTRVPRLMLLLLLMLLMVSRNPLIFHLPLCPGTQAPFFYMWDNTL